MPRSLLLLVAVPFAAACGAETPPPRSAGATSVTDAAITAEPPPPPAPAPTSTASSGALPAAAPRTVRAPAYVVGGTGRRTAEWGPIFAPTQEKVAACVPGTSGVVTIRVENKGKTTLFTIDPNVSLDVQTRRCILEALSMIQLEEEVTKRLGPPGFTSHVVISW